ncbi:MAG TPA: alpha/beta hydrolase-fold protein [Povalibacter sp.]|uniref:alpha/beta hydrolase n=1 Tax=Povalibacter sp. TaxID=1962978 RepID=UPI002BFDF2AA|nr:alpha/beta hydrolase-fold protein [Povalibacter sp.]HMN46671.1 alpha/beta hydrolase-fold protein [Povalibacter sp.]
MKSAALFATLLFAFCATTLASTITTREFDSPALQRQWSYVAYLPTDYDRSDARYPVLYLLHGNGQKAYDWVSSGHIQQTADRLIASGEMPAAIIVIPEAGTTWYVDRKERMETAVMQDLLPEIQQRFRTIEKREGRVIAGLSMGGFGAARFALKYPETFAAAGLLSPAIYRDEPPENSSARRVGVFGAQQFDPQVWHELNYTALWDAYLQKKLPVPMYVNSGDDDAFYIEGTAAEFYTLLRRNEQPAELRIVDGGHTWAVWESTIGDVMKYVFRFVDARPMALR